jgi:hypothetical protein
MISAEAKFATHAPTKKTGLEQSLYITSKTCLLKEENRAHPSLNASEAPQY